ncbi:MAG: VCBS repeat-containing protein [Verrucomicrobiales bacterium]|nr:VCBS repeat-containing protein [Verrucomicrobiales bacterium]
MNAMHVALIRNATSALAILFALTPLLVPAAHASEPTLLVDVSRKLEFVRELGDAGDGLAGAAWLDFDNDGFLDLFVPNVAGHPNALFHNNRDGTFANVASSAGVANGTGNTGAIAGDINNDSWADLFLTYAGSDSQDSHTKLYLNKGDGTFADITESSGVVGERSSFSPAFADINNDGFLDVFITSIGTAPGLPTSRQFKNTLYLSNGDLTFKDISASSGVDTALGACATTFGHYDDDQFIDLFVGNCNDVGERPTPLELFHNNGDLTFADVRRMAGTSAGGFWEGLTMGDYDNDGDLDLFVTNFGAGPYQHALYENQGDGTYRNQAANARLTGLGIGWGTSFADFDNDGFQDLFLAGSLPIAGFDVIGPGKGNPGYLLMNNRDKTFRKEATFGLGSKFTSGVAVGDFDNNGFPDVLVVTSKFTRDGFDPDGRPVLLQNSGNGNHWLTIKTVGTRSNRDGIGARVMSPSVEQRALDMTLAG